MIWGLLESTWGGGTVIDKAALGTLFDGLRAAVTIADQDFQISFMNDRATAFYAKDGGAKLIGRNLLDCHRDEHKTVGWRSREHRPHSADGRRTVPRNRGADLERAGGSGLRRLTQERRCATL